MTITLKMVSTIVGILGSVIVFGVWVFTYHTTLATKADIGLLYVDLRLKDVQDSVFNYSGKEVLSEFDKEQLTKLKKTLERLEVQREKFMGFSK